MNFFERLKFRMTNLFPQRQVKRRLQKLADEPGPHFNIGDRVKAVCHRVVDDEGGTGIIRAVDIWSKELRRHFTQVEFDSMPGKLFFMSAAELRHVESPDCKCGSITIRIGENYRCLDCGSVIQGVKQCPTME